MRALAFEANSDNKQKHLIRDRGMFRFDCEKLDERFRAMERKASAEDWFIQKAKQTKYTLHPLKNFKGFSRFTCLGKQFTGAMFSIMLTDPTYNSEDESTAMMAESPPPARNMRTKPVRGKGEKTLVREKYAEATEVILRTTLTIELSWSIFRPANLYRFINVLITTTHFRDRK